MSKVESFAVIISSDVRIALVDTLNPNPRIYSEMKENIKEILGREVSDGSLSWHIEKLKGIGVIQKRADGWKLTDLGTELSNLIKSVENELV